LGEQVAILEEQGMFERLPHTGEEADRAIQMLQLQTSEAGALDGRQPRGTLQIASGRAQPLESQREACSLDVELEAALAAEAAKQLGEPLLLPEPLEDEGGAP